MVWCLAMGNIIGPKGIQRDSRKSALIPADPSCSRYHRGLQNLCGENNCFLNVCLQTLWHSKCFRSEVTKLEENPLLHISYSDMVSAVNSLFAELQYSEKTVLAVPEIRDQLLTIDPGNEN